jgi:hypothetical protein
MRSRAWAFVAAVAVTTLSISPQQVEADGATSTFNIVNGAVLTYLASKRLQAEHNIDHNKALAVGIMDEPLLSGDTMSLSGLRTGILNAAHNDSAAIVRTGMPSFRAQVAPRFLYETLRACWNSLIFATSKSDAAAMAKQVSEMFPSQMPSPSPSASPSASPSRKSSDPPRRLSARLNAGAAARKVAEQEKKTDRSGTSSPSGGGDGGSPGTANASPSPGTTVDTTACVQTAAQNGIPEEFPNLDVLDAMSAFNAPPLSTQISAGNVAGYDTENHVRAQVLFVLGTQFEGAAGVSKGPETVQGLSKDCYTSRDAAACAVDLAAIETSLESAYANAQSCDFARNYWLPPFSAIKRTPSIKDFGPVPGCS